MTGKTFVDTNVLIYAHDVDAKAKHETTKNVFPVEVIPTVNM